MEGQSPAADDPGDRTDVAGRAAHSSRQETMRPRITVLTLGVDDLAAEAAGAEVIREAHETFWGGYAGYFADLDGHLWEIGWNPAWELPPDS